MKHNDIEHCANDLALYIINTGELYDARKKVQVYTAKKIYQLNKGAAKKVSEKNQQLFWDNYSFLVTEGVKRYCQEFSDYSPTDFPDAAKVEACGHLFENGYNMYLCSEFEQYSDPLNNEML